MSTDSIMKDFIILQFGVDEETFMQALKSSPSAQGYIHGTISGSLLKDYLEAKGFEVIRIKEKPAGGYDTKSIEARGDFYIKKRGIEEDRWLVIESKGLKRND